MMVLREVLWDWNWMSFTWRRHGGGDGTIFWSGGTGMDGGRGSHLSGEVCEILSWWFWADAVGIWQSSLGYDSPYGPLAVHRSTCSSYLPLCRPWSQGSACRPHPACLAQNPRWWGGPYDCYEECSENRASDHWCSDPGTITHAFH